MEKDVDQSNSDMHSEFLVYVQMCVHTFAWRLACSWSMLAPFIIACGKNIILPCSLLLKSNVGPVLRLVQT